MADEYVVVRTLHVDAPPSAIYERAVDFRRWQSWSPWEDLDPDLHREYSGADEGPGAIYEWSGNRRAGQGRMEITGAEPDQRLTMDLRFEKPFTSQSVMTMAFEPDGGGTRVRWTLRGPVTLMSRVMGLFTSMDKMVGPDFEKGLGRLKAEAEAG